MPRSPRFEILQYEDNQFHTLNSESVNYRLKVRPSFTHRRFRVLPRLAAYIAVTVFHCCYDTIRYDTIRYKS